MTSSIFFTLLTISCAFAALLTDPTDTRKWQGADIGTFARLFYGTDDTNTRNMVISNQLLDDGILTADLSQTGTLVPTSWAQTYGGCLGESNNQDYGYTCSSTRTIYELANNIDNLWFQSSGTPGNTVWDLGVDAPQAGIFITVDHGPLPVEAIESTHFLGPSPTGPWTKTNVVRVYLQGYLPDTANSNIYDGFTYVVRHPTDSSFRYISAIHGGAGALQSDGDDEINGVVALDLGFNPIRPSFNVCINFASYSSGTRKQFNPILLSGRWTANAGLNYAYSLSTRSYGTRGTPTPQSNTMLVFFSHDYQNLFNLNFLLDSNDGTGGSATVRITTKFFGNTAAIEVFDDPTGSATAAGDPADSYQWFPSTGVGEFQWTWGATTTDGLSLGPIPVNVSDAFSITIEVVSSTGLNQIVVMSQATPTTITPTSYPINQPLTIVRESCTCGNNIVELFEQCDGEPCCSDSCRIDASGVVCRPKNGTCDLIEYCDGLSLTCPPDQSLDPVACNCSAGMQGQNCDKPICDYWSNCSACTAFPECGWCCASQHCSEGTISGPTAGACATWQFSSCTCNPACTNGVCQCGTCVCDVGRTGPTCSEYLGCDGQVYTSPTQLPPVDVCGVCQGNGTTCLGCDGLPFGKTYDHCGVCGGDGSTCVEVCPGKSCEECLSNPSFNKEGQTATCQWCKGASKCIDSLHSYECGTILTDKSTCDDILGNLNAKEVAGLGAGIIAAIVIGVVAAVVLAGLAGKKGYDAYIRNKNDFSGAQSNPMYKDGGRTGNNPFYEMNNK